MINQIDRLLAEHAMKYPKTTLEHYEKFSLHPQYSSSMTSVWPLVSQIQKDFISFHLEYFANRGEPYWQCIIDGDTSGIFVASDDSPSMAICLAALDAYGLELDE